MSPMTRLIKERRTTPSKGYKGVSESSMQGGMISITLVALISIQE